MSEKILSTRSLLELIDLFERSIHAVANGDGQRLRGVPGWDLWRCGALSDSDLAAWTERIGYAGSYPAPLGDDRVPVDIEEDDDPGRYRYRCPETFRTKYVSADLVAVHAVDAVKLLTYLADLLGVPQAQRSGITAPTIDGVLWRLGKMRIAHAQVDAWVVRGLSSSTEKVFEHFRAPPLPDQGLIFTTGQDLPAIVMPPRAYRIVPIASALVDHAIKPYVDIDLIHRLLLAPAGTKVEKSLPVRFDRYSNTLVIATKSDKPWPIKGARQIAVVSHLFEQFENGRHWVPAREILDAVYGPKKSGRSQRIQNIFSGNLIWEDYIAGDGNGKYGFNLD
nr:hypothetical protein [Thiomonas arsenitoxydans]